MLALGTAATAAGTTLACADCGGTGDVYGMPPVQNPPAVVDAGEGD
ncbi:MAG: hypothetical protein KIT84_04380 [Labilithrix sp.]|nr:hypothetical protein [Labilithrix sp.]